METNAQHQHIHPLLPVRIDRLHLDPERSLFVVRDDLLPAGTKQRAVLPLLRDFQREGATRMIYASPFAGFAQVALAYGCHSVGLACTLFCERDPTQAGVRAHAFTELARSWGAEVILVDSLAEAEKKAEEWERVRGGHKVPLGFHCREFQRHFQRAVAVALAEIRVQLGFLPRRAWLPVGSGTLTKAFRQCAPDLELHCVDVHVLPENDLRLQALRALPKVTYYAADRPFRERATHLPPVPSNLHYDAKLWAVLEEKAEDGDLWWNVAR